MAKRTAKERIAPPTFKTVVRRIALASGILKGGEYYMTKYEMIRLCQAVLKVRKQ